jgi:hypothetical protein
MGRITKELYAGAYIKVNAGRKEFENFTRGDFFFEKYEGEFNCPYEGLEFDNILMPTNIKCRLDNDTPNVFGDYSEFEILFDETFFEEIIVVKSNCEHIYKDCIYELKAYFGDDNVYIIVGIIQYNDECA